MKKNIKSNSGRLKGIRSFFSLPFALLPLLFALFTNSANASDPGHSQLMRNSTLETAAFNKALLPVNSSKKFTMGNSKEIADKKITAKSKELEGVFLSIMLEPMFPEGKESNLYGGGTGQEIFRSMMIQEYGKVMADAGGVGLTKGIEKQLRQQ